MKKTIKVLLQYNDKKSVRNRQLRRHKQTNVYWQISREVWKEVEENKTADDSREQGQQELWLRDQGHLPLRDPKSPTEAGADHPQYRDQHQ